MNNTKAKAKANTKDLMDKAYKAGLNVYQMRNMFQKEMLYELPDYVMDMVCEEYLKRKPKIRNPWAYMAKVLQLKRDEAYVSLQKEREKANDYVNKGLLKNLFGGENG